MIIVDDNGERPFSRTASVREAFVTLLATVRSQAVDEDGKKHRWLSEGDYGAACCEVVALIGQRFYGEKTVYIPHKLEMGDAE